MRPGSGIAPIRRLLQAGGPAGCGVDGSAGNDGAHGVTRSNQASLLERHNHLARLLAM